MKVVNIKKWIIEGKEKINYKSLKFVKLPSWVGILSENWFSERDLSKWIFELN